MSSYDDSPKVTRVETPRQDPGRQDERQAPLIGHYHELSFLTDLQIRILVTAWINGNFDRAVRLLSSSNGDGGGVEIGGETIEGPSAVEAATTLLASGYLGRGERGALSMTARGRRIAELASQSARTMRVADAPGGHA